MMICVNTGFDITSSGEYDLVIGVRLLRARLVAFARPAGRAAGSSALVGSGNTMNSRNNVSPPAANPIGEASREPARLAIARPSA